MLLLRSRCWNRMVMSSLRHHLSRSETRHINADNCRKLRRYFTTIAGIGVTYGLRHHLAITVYCDAADSSANPWLIGENIRDKITDKLPEKTKESQYSFFLIRWTVTFIHGFSWYTRLTLRLMSLSIQYIPLMAMYPLFCFSKRTKEFWWRWAMWVISHSGPTIIKLGQWASTRRDLFSKEFCDKLGVLHTRTKQKKLKSTDRILDEVFGAEIGRHLVHELNPEPIGSGCIAQVYKAVINVPEFERTMHIKLDQLKGSTNVVVAIKVANRGIVEQIARDLSILRTGARILQVLVPGLAFVNPVGCLNQFETVLTRQVDLRNEALALKKFGENFNPAKTGIRFPIVLGYSRNVLIETFEEGVSISRLIEERPGDELTGQQLQAVRKKVALMGARGLMKMIFMDNFIHGDLHPGNIFIRFQGECEHSEATYRNAMPSSSSSSDNRILRGWEKLQYWFNSISLPRISNRQDEPELVILDTGIAIEETQKNLRNLRWLFWLIIENSGYEAAELMLSQSPKQHCVDPDEFCQEVAALVDKARAENASLRTFNISSLLSQMFSIVSRHKVSLEPSFTAVIMAVMLLEGLGRSLDPELDLFHCARPFLLTVLRR